MGVIKFLIFPFLQSTAIMGLVFGGNWVWLGGIIFLFAAIILDYFVDYSDVEECGNLKHIGMPIIYLSCLLQVAIILTAILNSNFENASAQTVLGVIFTVGLFTGAAGGNLGHELIHKNTWYDRAIGRVLFSLSFHSSLAIEHLYGHHITVGTDQDRSTAKRGEALWPFMVVSYIGANIGAWKHEQKRMNIKGYSVFSIRNNFLQGHIIEISYLAIAFYFSGPLGLLIIATAGLIGIGLMESFNYIAHYGLVRVAGTPFDYRHAWNSKKFINSGFTFNISHHASHHLSPSKPYWQLDIRQKMPMLPHGPSTMVVIAMFPKLWRKIMDPILKHWDEKLASKKELEIIANWNAKVR